MPSPTTAERLRALIPKIGDRLCDRFQAGISGYMEAIAEHFEWKYRDDGTLSAAFTTDLCLLECITNGGNPGGGTEPCPVISLSGSAVIGDTIANLTFSGTNLVAGYAWSLFRKINEGDAWGAAISTGTTTGSTITYADTGLTNDQPYRYRIEVQKGGCPLYYFEITGVTPKECQTLSYALVGGPDTSNEAGGGIVLTLVERDGRLADTFLFSVYVSNDPTQLGSLVLAEQTVADSGRGCNYNGLSAICMSFGNLDTGKTYYYTVRIKEKAACDYADLKASAMPFPGKPNAVGLEVYNAGGVQYMRFSGIVNPMAPPHQVIIYAMGVGSQSPVGQGYVPYRFYNVSPVGGSINQSVAIRAQEWPCNEYRPGTGLCFARYQIYAVVVSSRGGRSLESNPALINAQFFGNGLG